MKLKPCEFEEPEYRGPLFNQLHTSSLLWEPGQVFEKHVGIDHAMWTTHAYLHSLHGYSVPIEGAILARYRWDYIWQHKKRRKKLPSFRLNVFIQAKRPQYGRYAPKALRDQGLKSPFWRFELTPHQQVALERLRANLKDKALVCYACPAFHKESLLHKWTITPKIVENSTFPDVSDLSGHSAWNFSQPGAKGVANAEPTPKDGPTFLERLNEMVERHPEPDQFNLADLLELADAVRGAMDSGDAQSSSMQAQFADSLLVLERISSDEADERNRQALLAYSTVLFFAQLNRLTWFVAGRGG